jgi:hypothetical protein
LNPIGAGVNQQSQGIEFVAADPISGNNVAGMALNAGGSLTLNTSKAGGTILINSNPVIYSGTGALGMQAKRVAGCSTAASLNATCDTTVTWNSAYADANYTAVCTGDAITGGVPIIEGISISAAKTGAAITVRTISITAAAATFTTIDCTAIHD